MDPTLIKIIPITTSFINYLNCAGLGVGIGASRGAKDLGGADAGLGGGNGAQRGALVDVGVGMGVGSKSNRIAACAAVDIITKVAIKNFIIFPLKWRRS